jgi:hypothetical protein
LFHTAAGIDYFFLYNNDSEDDFRPIVAPWINRNKAELIEWPGKHQQTPIYDDCLERSRGRVDWLAFIDDDEFLFDSEGDPLGAVLRNYSNFAGLTVSWFLYGTSGRIYHEPEYVISRFTRRRFEIDQHHKCIVQPSRIIRSNHVGHMLEPKEGEIIVDQGRNIVTTPTTTSPFGGRLRINHYLTKSVMELIERRTSRDILTGDKVKLPLNEWLLHEKDWNAVEDLSAQNFLGRMEFLATEFPPS